MSYEEIIKSADVIRPHVTLPSRISRQNPDHNLWNNHGTWWVHFTLHHRHTNTSERIRLSLKTGSVETARIRRDKILSAVG